MTWPPGAASPKLQLRPTSLLHSAGSALKYGYPAAAAWERWNRHLRQVTASEVTTTGCGHTASAETAFPVLNGCIRDFWGQRALGRSCFQRDLPNSHEYLRAGQACANLGRVPFAWRLTGTRHRPPHSLCGDWPRLVQWVCSLAHWSCQRRCTYHQDSWLYLPWTPTLTWIDGLISAHDDVQVQARRRISHEPDQNPIVLFPHCARFVDFGSGIRAGCGIRRASAEARRAGNYPDPHRREHGGTGARRLRAALRRR